MSTSRPRRVTRRTAEQLLRGARAGQRGAGPEAMADLLAAAAAPARQDELAGQPAALAAFRSAQLGPAPQLRRRSVIKSALARPLAAKVAAVVVVAVSFGGVATAAVTGHLPAHSGPTPTLAPASGVTRTPARSSSVGSGPVVPLVSNTSAAGQGNGHASPSPDLMGLCQAYSAGGGAPHSPAFADLIDTAGGVAKVPSYCATLLHGQNGKSSSATQHGSTQHGGAPHPSPDPSHGSGDPANAGH